MTLTSYEAKDLFQWLTDKEDILVLDVRNKKDFSRFQVESPYPFDMLNVSYYDFMEIEDDSVAKVPKDVQYVLSVPKKDLQNMWEKSLLSTVLKMSVT